MDFKLCSSIVPLSTVSFCACRRRAICCSNARAILIKRTAACLWELWWTGCFLPEPSRLQTYQPPYRSQAYGCPESHWITFHIGTSAQVDKCPFSWKCKRRRTSPSSSLYRNTMQTVYCPSSHLFTIFTLSIYIAPRLSLPRCTQ